jgi:hypothetical protein
MKLPAKLFSCDMYSIGLYVWLKHDLSSKGMHKLVSSTLISKHISQMNGLTSAQVDLSLTRLEKLGLIEYHEHFIIISDLIVIDHRCHELDSALDGMWMEWIEYREKKKKKYIDSKSEQRQYDQLMEQCSGNRELAKNVLANAIARQWIGYNTAVYLEEQTKIKAHGTKQGDTIGRIPRSAIEEWVQQG